MMYFFINLESIFYFKSWTKLPTQFLSVQSICASHLILLSIHLVYSTLFHHLQNRYEKFTSWQGLFSPHYPHHPRHTPATRVLMGLSYCHVSLWSNSALPPTLVYFDGRTTSWASHCLIESTWGFLSSFLSFLSSLSVHILFQNS